MLYSSCKRSVVSAAEDMGVVLAKKVCIRNLNSHSALRHERGEVALLPLAPVFPHGFSFVARLPISLSDTEMLAANVSSSTSTVGDQRRRRLVTRQFA